MSCVLRVSGTNLDLDVLLESFPLGVFRIWRKGEPRISASPNSKVNADFGACFDVSLADFDEFAQQQEDATNFLVSYRSALQRLVSFPGVEHVQLDFGVNGGASCARSVALSPTFLRAAADVGIAVGISHYLLSEDEAALGRAGAVPSSTLAGFGQTFVCSIVGIHLRWSRAESRTSASARMPSSA